MLNIEKTRQDDALTLTLTGRLDTATEPELETVLRTGLEGVRSLLLDFTGLDYISSAGLRVLLGAQKVMNRQGEMKLRGVNETITEIFDITGFTDILTIE